MAISRSQAQAAALNWLVQEKNFQYRAIPHIAREKPTTGLLVRLVFAGITEIALVHVDDEQKVTLLEDNSAEVAAIIVSKETLLGTDRGRTALHGDYVTAVREAAMLARPQERNWTVLVAETQGGLELDVDLAVHLHHQRHRSVDTYVKVVFDLDEAEAFNDVLEQHGRQDVIVIVGEFDKAITDYIGDLRRSFQLMITRSRHKKS